MFPASAGTVFTVHSVLVYESGLESRIVSDKVKAAGIGEGKHQREP